MAIVSQDACEAESMSTAQRIAERIRQSIYAGHFNPGDHLIEQELAERYGISRSPIREAIRILAAEGTATLRTNRGAVVAEPTLDDVLEVYAVRKSLGTVALIYAATANSIPPKQFAALYRQIDKIDAVKQRHSQRRMVDADLTFQTMLMTASGLTRVGQAFRTTSTDIRLFVQALRIPYSIDNNAAIVERHRQLLAILEARDAGMARELWFRHIRLNIREFASYFEGSDDSLKRHPLIHQLTDGLPY